MHKLFKIIKGVVLLRILAGIGVLLPLLSWSLNSFSMFSNEHLVWKHHPGSYEGIPIRGWCSGTVFPVNQDFPLQIDKSVSGNALKVDGKTYQNGIGTFSPSKIILDLNKRFSHFSCLVGVEGDGNDGVATIFHVWADGKMIYSSPPVFEKMEPQNVDLNVVNIRELCLEAEPYSYDLQSKEADWLNVQMSLEKSNFEMDKNFKTTAKSL